MKKSMMLLYATCAAIELAAADAVTMKPEAPWKIAENGEASISYPGENWPTLRGVVPVKADMFYLVEFEAKCNETDNPPIVILESDKTLRWLFTPSNNWARYQVPFFNQNGEKLKVGFYFNPGKTTDLSIRNVKVEEMKTDENLLADGDFELGNPIPAEWIKGQTQPEFSAKIVDSPAFMCGEKSMMLTLRSDGNISFYSKPLPVFPGKNMAFSFWAKGSSELSLTSTIDCGSQFGKQSKHLYWTKTFKLIPEWKQYELTVKIPEAETNAALLDKTGILQLSAPKGNGQIWLDNLEFRVK